jgi:DNA topoisomerase I
MSLTDQNVEGPQQSALAVIEKGRRHGWWRREGTPKRGFRYTDPDGGRIRETEQLERIKALRIPPAWKHVRISPSPNSRLQAIGMDTSGRVQYLYHVKFAEKRQQLKFARIERFAEFLPALRRATNEDIALEGFPRERVLAIIVRLINELYFRLGSEKSVKRYRTYGVTTLRNRHLEIQPGGQLLFKFTGKHHIKHRQVLVDEELGALMAELKALGGSRLFNYLDEQGRPHPVTPSEVNSYIKQATCGEFSAKDFRTWGGTILAAIVLAELGAPENERQMKRNVVRAAQAVAERLGNTPAVCRSSYIHPVVFEKYQKGITLKQFRKKAERAIRKRQPEYEVEELALMQLFKSNKASR